MEKFKGKFVTGPNSKELPYFYFERACKGMAD
jgi:hypothetical protein